MSSKPPSTAASVDQLVDVVMEFAHTMRKHFSEAHAGGSNMLQVHALGLVEEGGGMTVGALAKALHVTAPSASVFVGRLVRRGFLRRARTAKNRKLVHLHLTPAGRALVRRERAKCTGAMRDVFSLIPEEQRRHASAMFADLCLVLRQSPPR